MRLPSASSVRADEESRASVVDLWLIKNYVDVSALEGLPPLDLGRPLPWDQVVPLGYAAAYLALSESFNQVWRPKSELLEMVETVTTGLGLSEESRGHVIG